jgi:hypothetical protein
MDVAAKPVKDLTEKKGSESTTGEWMYWMLAPVVIVVASSINSLCMKYQMTLTVI